MIHTQSDELLILRLAIYSVDLTLRDGVNLQEAITSAKQIDEQSKAAGFYQEALDHVACQLWGGRGR